MLRYTLLADGSSDRVLLFPIQWCMRRLTAREFEGQFVEEPLLEGAGRDLAGRVRRALRYYPCDLLMVHRDAERETLAARRREIVRALAGMESPPAVCVVPVRMTEAWLLIEERAIRVAAGNPDGSARIAMPRLRSLEKLPDPKATLAELVLAASERTGRRRKAMRRDMASVRRRVAELIDDWSPLEKLPAFRSFQEQLERVVGRDGVRRR